MCPPRKKPKANSPDVSDAPMVLAIQQRGEDDGDDIVLNAADFAALADDDNGSDYSMIINTTI